MPYSASGIPYWSSYDSIVAVCDDCDWSHDLATSKNGQGLAALHSKRTGHVVRVDIGRSIVYGELQPRAGAPGGDA